MGNPFPGMNPYLEQPELWHQVHNRLIVAMSDDKLLRIYADDLTPKIASQPQASPEEEAWVREVLQRI